MADGPCPRHPHHDGGPLHAHLQRSGDKPGHRHGRAHAAGAHWRVAHGDHRVRALPRPLRDALLSRGCGDRHGLHRRERTPASAARAHRHRADRCRHHAVRHPRGEPAAVAPPHLRGVRTVAHRGHSRRTRMARAHTAARRRTVGVAARAPLHRAQHRVDAQRLRPRARGHTAPRRARGDAGGGDSPEPGDDPEHTPVGPAPAGGRAEPAAAPAPLLLVPGRGRGPLRSGRRVPAGASRRARTLPERLGRRRAELGEPFRHLHPRLRRGDEHCHDVQRVRPARLHRP